MNIENIKTMEPGEELDALVAEKVMEYRALYVDTGYGEVRIWGYGDGLSRDEFSFKPSTDISAAWEVAEKFDTYKMQKLRDNDHRLVDGKNHQCFLSKNGNCAYGYTAPEAICKAALIAVMEEE